MEVAIHTLGCKVNQYETAALEQELGKRGHQLVAFDQTADAYIINTCTVTAVSDKKSRQMIRQAQRRNPSAVVAVCGCYAQTAPEKIGELGVDLIAGTADRMKFIDDLTACVQQKNPDQQEPVPYVTVDNIMSHRDFERLSAQGMEGRTRAFLKIEDGCVNFCTYCIIPYARGRVRSMSLADLKEEASQLIAQGYKEIVLTGIEISSWSQPSGETLIDAIETICQLDKNVRIRLGSLEPRTITEDFCQRASKLENLCPHFHLSMQSGCDATLKRMNRKYDSRRYLESVQLLRQYFTQPAITTDLIVGFPQETEEEFAQTVDFIQQCQFSAMHIFPYSQRTGTPAATMEGQVEKSVKEDRAHRAAQVASQMQTDYLSTWLGKTVEVLFEETKGDLWKGHAPNYVEVRAQGENLHNQICQVKIVGVEEGYLNGELTIES